ncbi:DUF2231 domain-containing protein [Kribbella sp. NPDC004138]
MFERFGDLPLHVLVIHLTVVLLPVAALTGIVFAVVPRWRRLLRWPALVLGVGTVICAYVAKKSGEAFVTAVPTLAKVVALHEKRGNLLFWYCLTFAVVAVAAFLLLRERDGRTGTSRPLELLTQAAVVVVGVLVIWQTIRTGDAGARAVWEGQLPK